MAPRLERLVHSVDFQRVLAAPVFSRSAHFAVHHLSSRPSAPGRHPGAVVAGKLSTIGEPEVTSPVDDSAGARWLGSVVPKRHARRAVTRSLLKRQIRAAVALHAQALRPGLWVVRLKAPFAVAQFPSAASAALRGAARAELDALLAQAAR